ncbi:hypothetical protein JHK87_011953 [Glycine soja]|nr:hypothetical protein JHK87_011953 [Glycine soja]
MEAQSAWEAEVVWTAEVAWAAESAWVIESAWAAESARVWCVAARVQEVKMESAWAAEVAVVTARRKKGSGGLFSEFGKEAMRKGGSAGGVGCGSRSWYGNHESFFWRVVWVAVVETEALAKVAATKTKGARMPKENNRKVENGNNAVLHDGKQHANNIFPMNQYPPDSSTPSNKFC